MCFYDKRFKVVIFKFVFVCICFNIDILCLHSKLNFFNHQESCRWRSGNTLTSHLWGRWFKRQTYVGKLIVAYRWQAVYNTAPRPTVCTGFFCHKTTHHDMTCTVLKAMLKAQINKQESFLAVITVDGFKPGYMEMRFVGLYFAGVSFKSFLFKLLTQKHEYTLSVCMKTTVKHLH